MRMRMRMRMRMMMMMMMMMVMMMMMMMMKMKMKMMMTTTTTTTTTTRTTRTRTTPPTTTTTMMMMTKMLLLWFEMMIYRVPGTCVWSFSPASLHRWLLWFQGIDFSSSFGLHTVRTGRLPLNWARTAQTQTATVGRLILKICRSHMLWQLPIRHCPWLFVWSLKYLEYQELHHCARINLKWSRC